MVLKRREQPAYADNDPLRAPLFRDNKLTVIVIGEPSVVSTKYREEQPVIICKIKDDPTAKPYTLWANWNTFNYYIDMYGEQEMGWLNQPLHLKAVLQRVGQNDKMVIYPDEEAHAATASG